MTLQEAYNFFESFKKETTKKSEIKIYENFLHILSELKNREFSKDEIQSLETELEHLNLEANPGNRKKYLNKRLTAFKEYLKNKHSLITVGYYANIGVSMGAAFGVVAGIVFGERFEKSLGISFGICMGLFIGAYIGRRRDAQAKAAGNML